MADQDRTLDSAARARVPDVRSPLSVPKTVREIVNLCGDLEQACLDMDPRKAEDVLYGLMMRARAFRQYLTEGGCLPFPEVAR